MYAHQKHIQSEFSLVRAPSLLINFREVTILSGDLALSYEAQLLYNRAPNFTPISHDLRRWRILISRVSRLGRLVLELELTIPEGFPATPPQLRMITPMEHPAVDKNTKLLRLEFLNNWNPTRHLYQLANILKELLAQAPQESGTKPQMAPAKTQEALETHRVPTTRRDERPIGELKPSPNKSKRRERKYAPRDIENRPSATTLESEKLALEILIEDLEKQYQDADISPASYAKLYKQYRKELNTVEELMKRTRSPSTA